MTIPKTLDALSPWLEDAWLERYLNRETNNDETAWFEAYMLEHPHVADALETDAAIATALSGTSPKSIQVRVAIDRAAERKATARKRFRPGWIGVAAAAALTLTLTTPFMFKSDAELAGLQPNRVLLDQLRTAGATALTVLDDTGAAWTMLEINTAARRTQHEVRIDDRPIGTYRSDDEGVLSVLLRTTPQALNSQRITAIKLTDLQAEPVEVTAVVDLQPKSVEATSKVCRATHQLRSTSDPMRFVSVGGSMAPYIDILNVRDDNTPGNPCASDRQGWTADEYIFICREGVGKQMQLFAHIKSNTTVDFECAAGRPVTLTQQDGQYSSAYWDDFSRGFRYYVMLEWDSKKCSTEGCEPYFLESFDLDSLAVNACFNHQPAMDIPSEQACADLPLSKQTEEGGGEKPPAPP